MGKMKEIQTDIMNLMKEQLIQIEADMLEICEDNENMKEAIRDYFVRSREEHDLGTDMCEVDNWGKAKELNNYVARIELSQYDDWANALYEFMLKSDTELTPERIKDIVKDFLEARATELRMNK